MIVTLAQWNVWVHGNPSIAIDVVRRTDADIWCMQELTRDSSVHPGINLDEMMQDLGYYALYVPTRKVAGDHTYEMGNAIFSRWPLIPKWKLQLQHEDQDSNPNAKVENRVAVAATVHTPAGALAVGSAHLSWQDELLMTEAPRLIDALRLEAEPFVMGIDLNVQPDSPYVKELDDFLCSLGPKLEIPTWPMMPVSFDSGKTFVEPLSRRYDYLYATPDIQHIGGDIIADDLVGSASDHALVLARIEM